MVWHIPTGLVSYALRLAFGSQKPLHPVYRPPENTIAERIVPQPRGTRERARRRKQMAKIAARRLEESR